MADHDLADYPWDAVAPYARTARAHPDGIVDLSVGEVVGDTLHCHVEKARVDYAGSYQAIVSWFAKYAVEKDTVYINREDDSGEENLRYSKLAYRPICMIDKYWVTISES